MIEKLALNIKPEEGEMIIDDSVTNKINELVDALNNQNIHSKTKSPYNLIEFNDLTDDLKLLAEVIGIENVRKLISRYSGIQLHIPRLTHLKGFCESYIEDNINVNNTVLAFRLDSSSEFVKNIKQKFRSLKARPDYILKGDTMKHVIAHGESGNAHVIYDDVVVEETNGVKVIKSSKPFTVVHEEHGPITINPETKGDVTIDFVVEYDHVTEEAKRVID